jgi:threonine-phosphate decarboxylase
MTKFFSLAGLRLGAMIGSQSLVEKVGKEMAPWSVNSLALAAGVGSLKDKGHIKKVREWFIEEHRFMGKALTSIDGVKLLPSSANFFMLKIDKTNGESALLQEKLLDDKILIRTLSEFTGLGDNFFRVAIKTREDNIFLVERLRERLGELQLVK